MMKCEFEELLKNVISAKDYEIVEVVYTWYPGIESKKQIVEIYKIGMLAILDLLPRAEKIRDLEYKKNQLDKELSDLTNRKGE